MKVAVIGAGFSGMLAAYLLEKEGITVTIYEKMEHIGGHCQTIFSKNVYTELGTVFSFSKHIKELLIELQVDYKELFLYKNYIDEHYKCVEHMSSEDVSMLLKELDALKIILNTYPELLANRDYGYIHKDLMLSFREFAHMYKLKYICQVITPYLSSFGLGNIDDLQAYYIFKVFNLNTLYSLIRGDKLLAFNKGTSELISKLSQNITDIRYSLEVKNIEVIDEKVKVETLYGLEYYDKVLITTKLPKDVIKDKLYNQLMKKIETNPYIVVAYEVSNKDLATTYFKANLGKKGKVQFFYASKQKNRTTLVAYAYGTIDKNIIAGMTKDIEQFGVEIMQLVTVKQWYIFPHIKAENLTQNFYQDIKNRQKTSNISLIGSLVTEPSIDNLYMSVKSSMKEVTEYYRQNFHPR
jgi:protoporphyrinogen oxidase